MSTSTAVKQKEDIEYILRDIDSARSKLLVDSPMLMREILATRIVLTKHIQTAAISEDGTIYINQDFWRLLRTDVDKKAVLLHEILHDILRHSPRGAGKNPTLWNIVCDALVNEIIRIKYGNNNFVTQTGITKETLYNGVVKLFFPNIHIDDFMRMSEEEMYDLLSKIQRRITGGRKGEEEYGEVIDKVFSEDESRREKYEKGGSRETGVGKDILDKEEASKAEEGKIGEVPRLGDRPRGEKPTGDEIVRVEAEINKDLSKQAGIHPGYMSEIINALKPRGVVDWRSFFSTFLRRHFGKKIVTDWKKPHRRVPGLFATKRLGPREVNVHFLIDVSGSIDSRTLRAFLEESMKAVTDAELDPESCTVVLWDVGVRGVVKLSEILRRGEIEVTGRGGTIIDDALKYSIEKQPDAVVVFTDGVIESTPETENLARQLLSKSKLCLFIYTHTPPYEFRNWINYKYRGVIE